MTMYSHCMFMYDFSDSDFSVLFPQLYGKCQGKTLARTLPNFCVVLCIFCVVLCIFVLFYVFLCCSMYFLCCSMYFLCCSMYFFCVVPCIMCFVTFPALFVCICVLNNCHRVATKLQLNISYQSALPVSYIHIAIFTLLEVYDSEDDGPTILSDFGKNSPVQRLTNFLSIYEPFQDYGHQKTT